MLLGQGNSRGDHVSPERIPPGEMQSGERPMRWTAFWQALFNA
jgi:hypothetical protein